MLTCHAGLQDIPAITDSTQAGPTHAGDEWLLDALGVSRSRVVHGLKELESLGLLQAKRDGRRVLYSSRSYLLLAGLLGSEAAGRAAADPARAVLRYEPDAEEALHRLFTTPRFATQCPVRARAPGINAIVPTVRSTGRDFTDNMAGVAFQYLISDVVSINIIFM